MTTGHSRPLGTGGEIHTHWTKVEPDDVLVLHTDGIVRTPARSLSAANAQLRHIAATSLDRTTRSAASAVRRGEEVCQDILSRGSGAVGDIRDDMALIVAARTPVVAPFSLRMPARPEAGAAVRAGLRDWLDGIGAGLLDHIGLDHAVAELVSNVAEHAYPDNAVDAERPLRVIAELDDRGSVNVTVSDAGHWRESDSDGRGLMMAAGMADTMDVRRGDQGTEVELRLQLARPVQLLQAKDAGEATHVVDDRDDELQTVAERGRLTARGPVDGMTVEVFHAALNEATRRHGEGDGRSDRGDPSREPRRAVALRISRAHQACGGGTDAGGTARLPGWPDPRCCRAAEHGVSAAKFSDSSTYEHKRFGYRRFASMPISTCRSASTSISTPGSSAVTRRLCAVTSDGPDPL